jgi:hypothetical protein
VMAEQQTKLQSDSSGNLLRAKQSLDRQGEGTAE